MTKHGRSGADAPSGLRPFGAEPAAQSQAEPLVPNAEEYGTAGYTCKGRLAATQHIVRAPNGTLLFESDRKNGLDGVIIDWTGDGVIILPADKFAALATMLCAKPFGEQAGIGGCDQHVTRPASAIEARSDAAPKSDAAEGESATRQGDAQP
jgi:hypothetical protein